MKKKITVAITMRGSDRRLLATIESVRERTRDLDCEIILVSDGPLVGGSIPQDIVLVLTDEEFAQGTSVAKHYAVLNAEHEVVVVCDSHMDFPEGCFEMYYDHLTAFPEHVVCSGVNMVPEIGVGVNYYAGCFKCKIVGAPGNATNRVPGSRQPFGVGWKDNSLSGPVQGVMGGCYGLTRSFYDTMAQPWQYGKGWGGDEESISLSAWYMGGLCWLLPQIVNHYSGTRGFVEDANFKHLPLYNRRRVVEMIDDKLTRNEFIRWFDEKHKLLDNDFTGVATWRDSFPHKRSFVDLIDDWENNITVKELYFVQAERGIKLKANIRKPDLLKMWLDAGEIVKNEEKSKNSGKKEKEKREYEKPKVHARANYGPLENRRICHKCGSGASEVKDSRTVGRRTIRYRKCLDCGMRRCTQEIDSL